MRTDRCKSPRTAVGAATFALSSALSLKRAGLARSKTRTGAELLFAPERFKNYEHHELLLATLISHMNQPRFLLNFRCQESFQNVKTLEVLCYSGRYQLKAPPPEEDCCSCWIL